MPIITLASHKGGVGKTTLAITLAHVKHLRQERVAVVDLDAPSAYRVVGSAASYQRARGLGLPAYTLDQMPRHFAGLVLVDGPPDIGDMGLQAAIKTSDLVLIPTTTSDDDLTVAKAVALEWGARSVVVFNRIPHYEVAAAARLSADLADSGIRVAATHLPERKAFREARAKNTTVAGLNTVEGRKATRPVEALLDELEAAVLDAGPPPMPAETEDDVDAL